jgi:CubicO group peptidase (beta-lactamase class C family)
MSENKRPEIQGTVKPGFEAVKEAFTENFSERDELGAACSIYYQGEKVVDLWGGVRNKDTGDPWEEDTMVFVASTTKGLSAMAIALAHARGWLDFEERVCAYWPEFAQQGKEKITVRQLLAHQAGLCALDAPVDRSVVADLDCLAIALAQQKPAWEPGTRQAYHGISLGFYEGELLRRVDPRHRSLGQFFQDEIASPLGIDFYIRLPEEVPNSRLAAIQMFRLTSMLLNFKSYRFTLAMFTPGSLTQRTFMKNPGTGLPFDKEHVYARNLEVPSQGGVGTARAIAKAYSIFGAGGRELGLKPETLEAIKAPGVPPLHGFYDEVLKREWQLSLGFARPDPGYPFGHPQSFGTPGAGGSFGFADPVNGVGYGYVLNRLGVKQGGDPRDRALREAFYRSIGRPNPFQEAEAGQPVLKPTEASAAS